MDLLTKLNANLVAANEASTYTEEQLKITKVELAYETPDSPTMTFTVQRTQANGGETFATKQYLKFTKTGAVRSPIYSSYRFVDKETGNALYGPSSLAYDLLHAIYGDEVKGLDAFNDSTWVGKTFKMGLKHGVKNDKFWGMLQTDSQKYYDTLAEATHAATGEWITDKAILREMDKGNYSGGGHLHAISDDIVVAQQTENKPINPGDLDVDAEAELADVTEPVKPTVVTTGNDLPF